MQFIFQIECISNTKDEKILQIRIDEATIEIFEKDFQISALRLVKPSVKKTYLTYIKTRAIDNELIMTQDNRPSKNVMISYNYWMAMIFIT